jgi:hypothetical protein
MIETQEIQEAPPDMSAEEEQKGAPVTSGDIPGKGYPKGYPSNVVRMSKMAAASLETAKEALNLATEKLSEML